MPKTSRATSTSLWPALQQFCHCTQAVPGPRQVPEHTWGADVKKAMPDYRNWSNAEFHAALAAGTYKNAIHCWKRQRAYLDWGLQALSKRFSHSIMMIVTRRCTTCANVLDAKSSSTCG